MLYTFLLPPFFRLLLCYRTWCNCISLTYFSFMHNKPYIMCIISNSNELMQLAYSMTGELRTPFCSLSMHKWVTDQSTYPFANVFVQHTDTNEILRRVLLPPIYYLEPQNMCWVWNKYGTHSYCTQVVRCSRTIYFISFSAINNHI